MRKVLAISLAVCFVFALSALAFDDMGKSSTVNGWVVDDKCAAKGANAALRPAPRNAWPRVRRW